MLNLEEGLKQKLEGYDKIWAGLSGGLDSIVLLNLLSSLPNLRSRIHAIHVHHGLSPYANDWQVFCQQVCTDLNIPLLVARVEVPSGPNLEAHARQARYQAFQTHIPAGSALCLAHHLDDHIETFFLQALRGSGPKGLAGIDVYRSHAQFEIFRPLLHYSREHILAYAKIHGLSWIDDESNDDRRIFRNYLRHEILPRIEEKWPHYRQSLQHTMNSCRELAEKVEPKQIFSAYLDLNDFSDSCDFEWQQLLRAWIKANTGYYPSQNILAQIIQQMIHAKRSDNEAMIHIGQYRVIAYRRVLEIFLHVLQPEDILWEHYPSPLWIESYGEINPTPQLIAKLQVSPEDKVFVRFRTGGEKISQENRSLCLKKQFQARGIAPYKRNRIPLLYINEVLCHVFFPE